MGLASQLCATVQHFHSVEFINDKDITALPVTDHPSDEESLNTYYMLYYCN